MEIGSKTDEERVHICSAIRALVKRIMARDSSARLSVAKMCRICCGILENRF